MPKQSQNKPIDMQEIPVDLSRVKDTLTSTYHSWIIRDNSHDSLKIEDFLDEKLSSTESSLIRAAIERGGAYVNGRRIHPGESMRDAVKVEFYAPKSEELDIHKCYPKLTAEHIIFEDNDLIAVFKPPGLPSIPSREQQVCSVKDSLKEYLKREPHMPSRIDTSTSGLIVASKSKRMHARLQQIYEQRRVKKYYRLQIDGVLPRKTLTVDAAIGFHDAHPVLRRVSPSEGKAAKTIFSQLRADGDTSLVQAQPVTGRTHQIRVHTAAIGLPITGDNFYGGRPAETLHLLSYSATFEHPITNEKLTITVPDNHLPEWARASNET